MHISKAEFAWGVGESGGEAVVDPGPVLGDQQRVVGHGVKTSIMKI